MKHTHRSSSRYAYSADTRTGRHHSSHRHSVSGTDASAPPGTMSIPAIPAGTPKGIRIPVITPELWKRLSHTTGPIPAPLTNDRMFRGIASYSDRIRRRLASILLGLNENSIKSVIIMNPISFGQAAGDKKTEQDIRLLVNQSILIDIEMQNLLLGTNNRRFLLYLCRNYDTVRTGEEYNNIRSNLLIGITDYPFDQKTPEFYAQYRMINTKTMRPLFPDEHDFFGFNILDLTQSSLADESDQTSGRTLLAKLLKAATWEELLDLCRESDFAKEVAGYMYASNMDLKEWVALDEARRAAEEKAYQENQAKRIAQGKKEIARGRKYIAQGKKDIAQGRKDLVQGQKNLAQGQKNLAQEKRDLAAQQKDLFSQQQDLAAQQKDLAARQEDFAEQVRQLAEKEKDFTEKERKFTQQNEKLSGLEQSLARAQQQILELTAQVSAIMSDQGQTDSQK